MDILLSVIELAKTDSVFLFFVSVVIFGVFVYIATHIISIMDAKMFVKEYGEEYKEKKEKEMSWRYKTLIAFILLLILIIIRR